MDGPNSAVMLPNMATLVEVGPRDGLQNEDVVLATDVKVELINRLAATGVQRIETASFVHPGLVPQMADAEAVMAELGPSPSGVSYIGLVLNRRGLERGLETSVDEINFSVAASEGFSASNQGTSVAAAMAAIEEMIPQAQAAGKRTTVTISVVWGCPFDGEVSAASVAELAERAGAAGAEEIALGDTIGVAVPTAVTQVLDVLGPRLNGVPLRVHFHDTRNTGIANVYAALASGVSTIDASVGGAGGCPFAPNATGNVATEDVLYMLDRSGIETGVNMAKMADIGRWLGGHLARELPAAIGKAGGFPAT